MIFNHRGLVSSGKSRSDGGDIRILWNSGSNWYALDRVVGNNSSWNRSNTLVFFQLAAGMGAYSSNSNYYLYYGCSSASNPPDDPNQVYWYYNNFNSDNALSGWTQRDVEDVGDWRIVNGRLEVNLSVSVGLLIGVEMKSRRGGITSNLLNICLTCDQEDGGKGSRINDQSSTILKLYGSWYVE